MKNNTTKYLLILFVVVVWGIIFYKVINFVKSSDSPRENNLVSANEDSSSKNVDTFTIIANYADPFLKRSVLVKSTTKMEVKTDKPQVNNASKKAVLLKNWPNISYAGLVSSFMGNKSTALISINGESCIMKKGDISKDIELVIITKDSVKLKFQNEYRFLKRNGTK
jgi:hypothetical protein